MTQREKSIIYQYRRAARKKARTCYYPGCAASTINTHLLQERGILDQIAEDGHIIELAAHTRFQPMRFLRTGINKSDMMTFNGFCAENRHDHDVFYCIENDRSDFASYHDQLLLSYRGHLNELFKQELLLDMHACIAADPTLSLDTKESFSNARQNMGRRLLASRYYKQKLERELWGNWTTSPDYVFHRFQLPRVEIATSAVAGALKMPIISFEQSLFVDPLADEFADAFILPGSFLVFVNLIPRHDSLLLILGHSASATNVAGVPVVALPGLGERDVFKLISDLLVKSVETWSISPRLHRRLVFLDKDAAIIRQKLMYNEHSNKRHVATLFNMFEGIV